MTRAWRQVRNDNHRDLGHSHRLARHPARHSGDDREILVDEDWLNEAETSDGGHETNDFGIAMESCMPSAGPQPLDRHPDDWARAHLVEDGTLLRRKRHHTHLTPICYAL
jgi:hypothetical protein